MFNYYKLAVIAIASMAVFVTALPSEGVSEPGGPCMSPCLFFCFMSTTDLLSKAGVSTVIVQILRRPPSNCVYTSINCTVTREWRHLQNYKCSSKGTTSDPGTRNCPIKLLRQLAYKVSNSMLVSFITVYCYLLQGLFPKNQSNLLAINRWDFKLAPTGHTGACSICILSSMFIWSPAL